MPVGLASRFIEAHPAEAARVLERSGPEVIREALSDLQVSTGAALLEAMMPHAAATSLAGLAAATAAPLVSHLRADAAVPLLLRLDAPTRAEVLKSLPARRAAPLRLALGFPAGSVGSLVDPDVLTVRSDTRIGEAIEIARRAPEALRKYLYVLDESHRLTGVVDARQCLLRSASRSIAAIERRDPIALRARAGLRQAGLTSAWERFSVLPVINEKGAFLGVVRRRRLFRAIAEQRTDAPDEHLGALAVDLAELFWGTTSSLLLGGPSDERRD